jgi:hypothetical protein
MTVKFWGLITAAVLFSACTHVELPASLVQLQKIKFDTLSGETIHIDSAAAYLKNAQDAYNRRDYLLADHYALAGLAEVESAAAEDDIDRLKRDVDKWSLKKDSLVLQIEKLQSRVDIIKNRIAVEQMRTHIETVIEKEALEAAAREEVEEGRLSGKERKQLYDARMLIARELLSAAKLRLFAAEKMVEAAVLKREQIVHLESAVKNTGYAVDHYNMLDVYRYAGQAAGIYNQLLSFEGDDSFRDDAITELRSRFENAELNIENEQLGLGVKLPLGKKGLDKQSYKTLDLIAGTVDKMSRLICIIAVSGSSKADRPVALRQSIRIGEKAGEYLSGILKNCNVSVFYIENQSPLNVLAGNRLRGAVLLVPAVERKN